MKNGLLIFSAPSGSGKSTIVNWLMKEHPELKLEMGREINTTGSKSNQAEMQNIVVKMKDELEQIKEQVLNAL